MKLTDVKAQIDAYFDQVKPLDVIKRLEKLGYQFEENKEEYIIGIKMTDSATLFINIHTPNFIHSEVLTMSTISINNIVSKYDESFVENTNSDYILAA